MKPAQVAALRAALGAAVVVSHQGRLQATCKAADGTEVVLWDIDQRWIRRGAAIAVVARCPRWLPVGLKIRPGEAGVADDIEEPGGTRHPDVVQAARGLVAYAERSGEVGPGPVDLLALAAARG